MKKIFLSLLLLLVSTGAIVAQGSLLATLSHEGEITVFYGNNALKEAHAAAAHGDAVTLTSGTFNAVKITKAITLRGAGMEVDSIKKTYPTIISGSFNIEIGDSVSKQLTIEGIYNDYTINIKNGLNNATFIKNRLSTVQYLTAEGDTAQYKNNRFIHCKIVEHFWGPSYGSRDLSFYNCYLRSISVNSTSSYFANCIIYNSAVQHKHNNIDYIATFGSLTYSTLYNCILIGYVRSSSVYYSYNVLPSTATCYNCIVTNVLDSNISKGDNYYVFKQTPTNTTNKIIKNTNLVFKSFNSLSYSDLETFELVDDLKTSFKGTDGTQVGIHGGSLPYSAAPTNPQITKCNVASRSTADGKLSVDIEVTSGE